MFESKLHLAERLDDLQKKCVTYSEKLEAAAASASDTAARQSILEIAESLKNVSV